MLRRNETQKARRLRVTLLSGDAVFEGPRPRSLQDLQKIVGVAMGLDCPTELVFCCGDTVLDRIEDAGEQVTAVRDGVMGLLGEFLRHAQAHDGRDLPEHLWPAREHRRLVLAAVTINGLTLEYASEELRADRDVVLAAVTRSGWALKHASLELRADRDVVLAAVERCCLAITQASEELRADRDFVLAAVARNGLVLQCLWPHFRADRDVVLAALAQNGRVLEYASVELRADRDVVMAALARNGHALQYASPELRADPDVALAAANPCIIR